MRRIYVLNDNNELVQIDAGVESYSELKDAPISTITLNTTVSEDGQLTKSEGHKWSSDEILNFCKNTKGGRYDILTEEYGPEILLIHDTGKIIGDKKEKLYKRITTQYDYIYNENASLWVTISDNSAGDLVFTMTDLPATVASGSEVKLEYLYYNQTRKSGIVKLYNNDVLISSATKASSTEPYIIDITKSLKVGVNQLKLELTIDGEVRDVYDEIEVISLTLESPFSDKELFENDTIDYSYVATGDIAKKVYFQIDDEEPISVELESGRIPGTQYIDTTTMSHGTHSLKVWAEAKIGSETITTDVKEYVLPIWKDENGGTIIVINESSSIVSTGDTVNINYSLYDVKDAVDVEQIYPEEFNIAPMSLPAITTGEARNWTFLAKVPSDIPTVDSDGNEIPEDQREPIPWILKIKADNSVYELPIIIKKGATIEYRTGAIYELNPIGRDNADIVNRDKVPYKEIGTGASTEEKYAIMEHFNYSTDGWIRDEEEKDPALKINANAWLKYDNFNFFTLLSNKSNDGLTFEVDIKGRNTAGTNRTLIALTTGQKEVLSIKEQSVIFDLGSIQSVEYKAEERIRIALTFGTNQGSAEDRIAKIYINGVLSYVGKYSNNNINTLKTSLVINPTAAFMNIYGIRVYDTELTMKEVLNNYIASFSQTDERLELYNKNNIYGPSGEVDYDAVKLLMPSFVFKVTSAEKNKGQTDLPPQKGKKRYGNANYVDPTYGKDFNEEYDNEKEKPVADVQGTSSQKYPRKNFKIKFLKAHQINDNMIGEKVYTFKKDFMDSSHENNSGLAKLVQTLYSTPIPPQVSYLTWSAEGMENPQKLYDINGNLVDFNYIYDKAAEQGDAFPSRMNMSLEVSFALVEGTRYKCYYKKTGSNKEYELCDFDNHVEVKSISIEDKSLVRTTIFGQPCAFFYQGPDSDTEYTYQGIYNFNTDKVATNNMELEEDNVLSFEFTNNISDGFLFKSCDDFTEIKRSFEYRAYENVNGDGLSIGLLEDYYLDGEGDEDKGLVKWANGGEDAEEDAVIPVLNALYNGENVDGLQLYTKIENVDKLLPINYPFLTKYVSIFEGSDPRTLVAKYKLNNGNIEAAYVSAFGYSSPASISETIKTNYGEEYYENKNMTPAPSGLPEGQALGVQIINSGTNYIVQWGYEEDGDVSEWNDYCYVQDLIETIDADYKDQVLAADVTVSLESGTRDDLRWTYKYPISEEWETVAEAGNIYDANGNSVVPTQLYKYDLYEAMYQPIKNVVTDIINCYKEYEKTKDLSPFKDYIDTRFNKEYVVTYYVMALFAGAADSMAKNMFWNSYDGGQVWYPVWYDIDTCFGLSNDGHPNFPYSLEIYGEGSKLGTADIYNGAKSNFWKMVDAAYSSEIAAKYNELRDNGQLSYDVVMKILYGEQISKIAPAHYNEDAAFSYLNYPTYYYTAQGSRYERLKYWVENRFAYLDSKFGNTNYEKNSYELRMNSNNPITLKASADTYLSVKFGQQQASNKLIKKRCLAGQEVTFDPEAEGFNNVNDLETIIYGASRVESFGDVSSHQVTSIKYPEDVDKENQVIALKEIKIGNEDPNYKNSNFTELTIGKNNVLTTVNVGNCVNLKGELYLSECPSIREVYAKNTQIGNVVLPDGSPISILHLPSTITTLKFVDQIMLSDLTIDGYNNVDTFIWKNTPNDFDWNAETILSNLYSNSSVLQTLRIIDFIPKESFTTSYMRWIMSKQGQKDNQEACNVPYITGKISIKTTGKDNADFKGFVKSFVQELGDKFVYTSTTDLSTDETTYYAYNSVEEDYVEIGENELSRYKLELHIDQIVEDEYIFGVTGEGE